MHICSWLLTTSNWRRKGESIGCWAICYIWVLRWYCQRKVTCKFLIYVRFEVSDGNGVRVFNEDFGAHERGGIFVNFSYYTFKSTCILSNQLIQFQQLFFCLKLSFRFSSFLYCFEGRIGWITHSKICCTAYNYRSLIKVAPHALTTQLQTSFVRFLVGRTSWIKTICVFVDYKCASLGFSH